MHETEKIPGDVRPALKRLGFLFLWTSQPRNWITPPHTPAVQRRAFYVQVHSHHVAGDPLPRPCAHHALVRVQRGRLQLITTTFSLLLLTAYPRPAARFTTRTLRPPSYTHMRTHARHARTAVTQPVDPTWRTDTDRTAKHPIWHTDAGRIGLRHSLFPTGDAVLKLLLHARSGR